MRRGWKIVNKVIISCWIKGRRDGRRVKKKKNRKNLKPLKESD